MLENEPARQERERRALDPFRVDRHHRHLEKIPDRFQEPLLVHLAGVEHLGRPRAAVQIGGKLCRLLARGHATRQQKIDEGITGRRIHALILVDIA
jgi:hypothetical protein